MAYHGAMQYQRTVSLGLLVFVLGGGVVFSWHALGLQFAQFIAQYGTLFQFTGITNANPLLTPCFYGSCAFVVAFVWALVLTTSYNHRSMRWLVRFLMFGVCFALIVLTYEALEYFKVFSVGVPISCAPGVHPLETPCFTGLLFFMGSALVAWRVHVTSVV